MANITQARCVWSCTDNTISGTIEFTVDFTETESRLDLVYRAQAVVQPSDESTKGVVHSTKTLPAFGRVPEKVITTYLDQKRAQVSLALPSVRPAGQQSVTVKFPVSISVGSLFSDAVGPTKWTTTPGLDLISTSLSLDVSTYASIGNQGATRLS